MSVFIYLYFVASERWVEAQLTETKEEDSRFQKKRE